MQKEKSSDGSDGHCRREKEETVMEDASTNLGGPAAGATNAPSLSAALIVSGK
jgi:hypothetical protein